jgi:hypothetical protein
MINRIGHRTRAFLLEEFPKNILEFETQLEKGKTKYHSFYFMSSGCINAESGSEMIIPIHSQSEEENSKVFQTFEGEVGSDEKCFI